MTINRANLKQTLKSIGFRFTGEKGEGKFGEGLLDRVQVDLENETITYPEALRVNEQQTTNFSAPENFVVLECVFRLLKKGYRPEHIELEKRWSLGHTPKGGRADICIYDATGQCVITIIECKTAGSEYKKARRILLKDGGQLFSYRQQEGSAKWLALYASDFKDGKVEYQTEVVAAFDDPQKVKQAEKDGTITLYREATSVETLFSVWQETYGKQLQGDLIFNPDSSAYNVQILPLRKRDLKAFTPEDNIVNRFEEILRHNNVSDKENAFNRLIALFICKLVDEYGKSENDEVEFQYRQGADTYESLQDRLQRLHQQGMQTFMKEEIFYVPADYPSRLFATYTESKRERAIEDLDRTIRILKFYSNNDFAFKDVHNEELFLQNGKILVEMVQLFERYRIVYTKKHQFLGDLFEQLLNKGFKQNEGQFFTPMPITRFIWDCLPMNKIAGSAAAPKYPRVVDYACGAGHFLTEAVEAINAFHKSHSDNSWVRDHIFGIEKDYRLARVSKVSLFMNGAGEGTIIFGDGLENKTDQGLKPNSFDVLVANPPYSVKAFKSHLDLKGNNFELLKYITDQGGEIEVLFVERIAQLLKPKGIAAVILPSSILAKNTASYKGSRELLLQNFKLRTIVQFESKTFGATGTKTVVLFLEKYDEPPKRSALISDCVEAILSGADISKWEDEEILADYLEHIEVSQRQYFSAVTRKSTSLDELAQINHFKPYLQTFNTGMVQKIEGREEFKTLSQHEQQAYVRTAFYDFIRPIEAEKLRYFALTRDQSTLVITAPSNTKSEKEFLGYEWSNRKGSEGIKISHPGGKLYNEQNRQAEGTLAAAVRDSFTGTPHLTRESRAYASVLRTKDMLDFSRTEFNLEIKTVGDKQIVIESKYPTVFLGELNKIEIRKGQSITSSQAGNGDVKVVAGGRTFAYYTDVANRSAEIITISASGANAGFVNYWQEEIFASDCTTVQASDPLTTRWLFYFLKSVEAQIMNVLQKGAAQPHVYPSDIERIKIPVLTKEQQQQVVSACSSIDAAYETTRMSIATYREKIQQLFTELDILAAGGGHRLKLADRTHFDIRIGKRVLTKDLSSDGSVPVYSANVAEPFGYLNQTLFDDFNQPSILWGIDGDWMVSYQEAGKPFYPTDHCGVLRVVSDAVQPRYLAHVLQSAGRKARFSRDYRASIDRISSLSIQAPDINAQRRTIERVEELEMNIINAQRELDNLSERRNEVVAQFLR
ncbi:N-6 DNA methylase [Actinotignum sp. GS-2025c]|uniref:N-6 DNA methylase n=1 Tax=Actinotignum sp. GS-2025c TaxID=3427276 RepID=UPI003F461F66